MAIKPWFPAVGGSASGTASRYFLPTEDTDTHMGVLAQLGKVLTEEPIRERLLTAATVDDMKQALLQATAPSSEQA